mgnify:CR=1 FL=1
MHVIFKKDHFSGIVAGTICQMDPSHAERLIQEGYVEEHFFGLEKEKEEKVVVKTKEEKVTRKTKSQS